MKKTVSFLLALSLMCGTAVGLTACNNDDPCTNHIDENHDGKCDNCQTSVEVKHVDEDNNGKCDVCNADIPGWMAPQESLKESMVKGIWDAGSFGESSSGQQMLGYVTFHADGIFYCNGLGGAMGVKAGYWELKEENLTIEVNSDYEWEGVTGETLVCPAYVILTNFDGTPYICEGDTAGTVNDNAMAGKYGIKDGVLYGVYYQASPYTHKPNETRNEISVTVESFFNEDRGATIVLTHDGKYIDMVGIADDDNWYYEGKWEYNSTTKVYTLTDTTGGGTATLKKADDGLSAEYKRGTTELTLTDSDVQDAKAILKLEGTSVRPDGEGGTTETKLAVELYDNNTFRIIMTDYGMDMANGTWVASGDNYMLTAEYFTTATGGQTDTMPLTKTEDGYNFMNIDFTVVRLTVLHVQGVMGGTNLTIKLSDDNTFTAVMSDYGMTMAAGTWAKDGENYNLTADAFESSFQTKTVTLVKDEGGATWTFANVGKFIEVEADVTAVFTGKRETPSQEEGGEPTVTYLTLRLHKEGTYEIVMTEYGQAMVSGSWTVADGVYSLTGFSALGLPLDTLTLTVKPDAAGTYTLQAMNLDFKLVA